MKKVNVCFQKILITLLLFCVCLPAMAQLMQEKGITVKNSIVSSNSSFARELSASIFFPDSETVILQGSEDVVSIGDRNTIRIISTAPYCNREQGFECSTLLPEHCYQMLNDGSTIMISGVVTNLGLDLRSLRCYLVEESDSN